MPINQFTAEIGRNVIFSLTAISCNAGVITDPAASTFKQDLSRMYNATTGVHVAFGHLERATISITPMQEEISSADSLTAHYETWKHDWELGLIGIRQVGAEKAVGLPDDSAGAGAINPLTEIMGMIVGANAFGVRNLLAKVEVATPDRIWTFYGTLGPYRWDYSGPRGSDSLSLRPIDIGTANPTYLLNPASLLAADEEAAAEEAAAA